MLHKTNLQVFLWFSEYSCRYVVILIISAPIYICEWTCFYYSRLPLHAIPIDKSIHSQLFRIFIYGFPSLLLAFAFNTNLLCFVVSLAFLLSVSCHFSRVHFGRTHKRRPHFSFRDFFFPFPLFAVIIFHAKKEKDVQPMGYKCIGKVYFQFGCASTICRFIAATVAVAVATHFYSLIFVRFLLNFYAISTVSFSLFCIDNL